LLCRAAHEDPIELHRGNAGQVIGPIVRRPGKSGIELIDARAESGGSGRGLFSPLSHFPDAVSFPDRWSVCSSPSLFQPQRPSLQGRGARYWVFGETGQARKP
jgi:hypothetical protein